MNVLPEKMKPPKPGKCHVRFAEEEDFAELERMYLEA